MAVSFVLACVWLLWSKGSHENRAAGAPPPAQTAPVLAQESRFSAGEPGSPRSSEPVAAASSRAERTGAPSRGEAPAPLPRDGIDYVSAELPVGILFRRDHGGGMYVGYLINKTESILTLDVTIVSPSSGRSAHTQLSMEPMGAAKIGNDDDLVIEPGDRVTLQNPSYNDLVRDVGKH
jgi:hypothetical protein